MTSPSKKGARLLTNSQPPVWDHNSAKRPHKLTRRLGPLLNASSQSRAHPVCDPIYMTSYPPSSRMCPPLKNSPATLGTPSMMASASNKCIRPHNFTSRLDFPSHRHRVLTNAPSQTHPHKRILIRSHHVQTPSSTSCFGERIVTK